MVFSGGPVTYKSFGIERGIISSAISTEEPSPRDSQSEYGQLNGCIQRDIYLVAHHVPGKSNVLEDQESRVFQDDTDWKLDPQVIKPFLSQCRTDLFATRLTCQLKQYISWRPDPKAVHTNALNVNWHALKGYAFPPFNLLPVVLNKVLADHTELVLVAPVWQAQPWWPLLLSLLTQEPVLLPNKKYLLINPSNPDQVHLMYPHLHLAVYHVSSNTTKQKDFLNTLPTNSSQQLIPPHLRHTNPAGVVGAAGVLKGRLIRFQQL